VSDRFIVRFSRRPNVFFYLWDYSQDVGVRYSTQLSDAKLFWTERIASEVAELTGGEMARVVVTADGQVQAALINPPSTPYKFERTQTEGV